MNTLDYITQKFNLKPGRSALIEIPNAGRDDLARLFHELDFRRGAEIGVEQGLYSQVLCAANPQAKIYGVDAWQAYRAYRDHVSQQKLDGFLADTQARLADYPNHEIIRRFSLDAVEGFADGSLDFVYIDANHELPYVINDIIEWSKKVRAGGIVSGHDYYESHRVNTKNHTKYAVDCYTRAYRIRPWFLWGSREKKIGETRDKSRSWMWVKS